MRFPGFQEELYSSYKKHFFKDIFHFSTGKNIKQNEASPEFEIPCVRYGELYYMYNEVIKEVINRTNLDKSELLLSIGDEILLPSAGEDSMDIGSASALTIENVAIGRTINILKPIKANIYSQIYVSYYINQKLRKKISTLAKGSSISNVYNSDLKTLEIVLPNLGEQTKTASFLSLIDERITTQRKTIGELKVSKINIAKKLFIQQLRFRDKIGNKFRDWEKKKLEEIFYSEKGRGISKNKIIKNGSNECILYGELYTKYNEVIFKIVSKTDSKEGTKSRIGDLLIPSSTTTTGIDLANVTALNKEDVLLGGDITILRSDKKINNIFYAYYLSNHKKEEIASYAQGSTIVHLYYNHIRNMIIDFPCFEEQTMIANVLSCIDKKINIENNILYQYKLQKKHLLCNLFI